MIRYWYNHIQHPILNTKREKKDSHKIWPTPMKDMHRKPNEQLFPKQVVIPLPKLKKAATSIFTYFLF